MSRSISSLRACCAAVLFAAAPAWAHEYYADGFTVIHPWAEATDPGATEAAIYFKLENVSRGDRMVRGLTPFAESVEFRSGGEGPGEPIAGLPFEPDGNMEFTPGQPHILLRGLKAPLQWGRSYLLTVVFERAGQVLMMVSVGAH